MQKPRLGADQSDHERQGVRQRHRLGVAVEVLRSKTTRLGRVWGSKRPLEARRLRATDRGACSCAALDRREAGPARRPAMGVANGRQPPRCKALSGFPPYVSAGAERILRAVWLETGQRVLAEEH